MNDPPARTTSALLVAYIEQAVKGGSAIADNLTELGSDSILVKLRAALPHAPVIAFGGDRFNACDGLVERTVTAMKRADKQRLSAVPEPDEWQRAALLSDDDDPEAWYLLGLLVGAELAGGVR